MPKLGESAGTKHTFKPKNYTRFKKEFFLCNFEKVGNVKSV
jgi:hypothetical protein